MCIWEMFKIKYNYNITLNDILIHLKLLHCKNNGEEYA